MDELYLGVDGGQSHTEAVIASRDGHVLGRGNGGPSNHAEQPGGRERLRRAIEDSVGGALRAAGAGTIESTVFTSAHCAMTGGADYKEEIISSVLHAKRLKIGHDAPAALYGSMGVGQGVVVIAGTGSVAYGEDGTGASLRVGGWGFLFGDEGAGFWVAAEGLRRSIHYLDGIGEPTSLGELALSHFSAVDLHMLVLAVYNDEISRDRLASFAKVVHRAAVEGDAVALAVINSGATYLAQLATTTARRLSLKDEATRVACVGGMFRGDLMRTAFAGSLSMQLPGAHIVEPRFDPAIGALLLSYRQADRELSENLLSNLATRRPQEGTV
jgi:N-acetylglucosamine kinase-like BadF-type ATPase